MSVNNPDLDIKTKVMLKNESSEYYIKNNHYNQNDHMRNYMNQGFQTPQMSTSHAFDPADNSPAASFNYQSYGITPLSSTNTGAISPAISSMNSFGIGSNMYSGGSNNYLYNRMNSTNSGHNQGRYVSDSPEGFSNSNRYFGGINEPRSEGADKEYLYNSNFGTSFNTINTPNIFDGSVRSINNFNENTEGNSGNWNLEAVPEAMPFLSNSPVGDIDYPNNENVSDLENDCTPGAVANSNSLCSKGSSGHPLLCRPCAFFWTKGCMNGKDCRFCHEWHPPKKKKPMKEQKNLMIIARPDGRIEFMRCTVQEALGVL